MLKQFGLNLDDFKQLSLIKASSHWCIDLGFDKEDKKHIPLHVLEGLIATD